MAEYLFQLSDTSTGTLQARIQEMLVSAIVNRHVRPGMPLPSGRKLATQLKVSRNTVVLAYQNLVDEGFIETRQRSGYYVCEDVLSGYAKSKKKEFDKKEKSSLDWKQLFSIQPSNFVTAKKQQDWPRIW